MNKRKRRNSNRGDSAAQFCGHSTPKENTSVPYLYALFTAEIWLYKSKQNGPCPTDPPCSATVRARIEVKNNI